MGERNTFNSFTHLFPVSIFFTSLYWWFMKHLLFARDTRGTAVKTSRRRKHNVPVKKPPTFIKAKHSRRLLFMLRSVANNYFIVVFSPHCSWGSFGWLPQPHMNLWGTAFLYFAFSLNSQLSTTSHERQYSAVVMNMALKHRPCHLVAMRLRANPLSSLYLSVMELKTVPTSQVVEKTKWVIVSKGLRAVPDR